MNLIDQFIAALDPIKGAKRAAARAALDNLRYYEAAQKNRRTAGWRSSSGSADADNMPALETLRNTARNMVRNNSWAFQAVDVLVTNVIGTGIRPNITAKSERVAKVVKDYWKRWAESTECDFDRDVNFYGLQSLYARSMFESGEVLIVRRRLSSRDRGVLPIRLQILEPDFLDTQKSNIKLANGNFVDQGIEFNSRGQRVAYWLFKEHPGNQTGYYHQSERVAEADIVHLYRKLRPGQQRGVPTGVSAFMRLNDFDDYENAQLVRQKIAACFVAFISGDPGGLPDTNTETKEPREKLAPGIIERLGPGQTVTLSQPPGTDDYDSYGRKVLQGVAAGYGATYEGLTGDLSNVNFSSGRMGELQVQRRYNDLQSNVFIPKGCGRVFNWFTEALFLVEGIDPAEIFVDWTAPRREMIDVAKETKAIIDQILAGLTSWDEAVRELGFNADDLAESIKKSQERFKKLGITLTSDPGHAKNSGAATKPPAGNVDKEGENPENTGEEED